MSLTLSLKSRNFKKELESLILFLALVVKFTTDSFALGRMFLAEDNEIKPRKVLSLSTVPGTLLE